MTACSLFAQRLPATLMRTCFFLHKLLCFPCTMLCRGSVFTVWPPPPCVVIGEEALLPLSTPINVCFRCSLEAMGPYGTPFAAATFTGGSFMKPGG